MPVDTDHAARVDLVLLWHMHQPDYRDQATGEFRRPWVYLHALKDYGDMAWHLERHPDMRVVVNFAPVLLDQLDDYARQFAAGSVRDPLLRLLAREDATALQPDERALILDGCFHTNHASVVSPFPAYRTLFDIFAAIDRHGPNAHAYASDQYLYDLLTWYHLGWTGETVRRESELVPRLMAKGAGFARDDRVALFQLIGATLSGVIPRWRRLAERGQVELSTTPEYHPIAPLLIDFASAREALPACEVPRQAYPGGPGRVRSQLDAALASHARHFGMRTDGVWPAEGGVSTELVSLLAERGVRWTASGTQVLRQSLAPGDSADGSRWLYRPYHVKGAAQRLACFFRDDFLSDRIGFEYAKWNGDDAAADLIASLERIGAAPNGDGAPLVSVILDGENCWEYYPYNGYYFIDALYRALEAHTVIHPMTYRDWLDGRADAARSHRRVAAGTLDRLVAGSWVAGNFTTWIGSPEKNRAWELLISAKQAFDLVAAGARLAPERLDAATRQLAVCEASDWFWWLSDANPAPAVADFDQLYRAHLVRLYELIDLPPPATLAQPICHGGGNPESGGTMRRADAS